MEDDFGGGGAFEFFEDDVVHAGAGVDEGGGDDGERSAFFDVAGGTEETFRALEGVGVDASGEDFAARGDEGVVGAGETRAGAEQGDYGGFVVGQGLGFFGHHFGDLDVAGGGGGVR